MVHRRRKRGLNSAPRQCFPQAVESNTRRDGGFARSLPAAGWTRMAGASLTTTCCQLSTIFRLVVGAGSVSLPAVTTSQTVMTLVVVMGTPAAAQGVPAGQN